MKINKFNIIISLGLIAIIGVIIMQLFIINNAYDIQKKTTEDKIYFALQDVLERLYRDKGIELILSDQVKKVKDDYYTVNVNNEYQSDILELYMLQEFKKLKIDLEFEYATYNCHSDKMVHGYHFDTNSIRKPLTCPECFDQKNETFAYFFAVHFPNITEVYLSNLTQYWWFTVILFLVLIIYVYSILLTLKQKKYANLQKDFINNMTHEFKTPLSSILIASDYLKNQQTIIEDKKLTKYNSIISEQTKKLNQHIEKILYVAKTDSKQVFIEKKDFNLNKVIANTIDNCNLKHQIEDKIQFNYSKDYIVYGDEFHTSNLIFNLLDNSVKYSGKDLEIIINLTETKKHKIKLTITDNGVGIPEKDLPFVFDKFYRVNRKDSKNIPGFGIGLSYVKRICDLHQWKIKIKNNPTSGTTVELNIK